MPNRPRVKIIAGPSWGQFYLDAPGESLIVGRAESCQVAIADQRLSRRHFRLAWDGTFCQVTDLGSANGTWVNGQRIQEAILRDGDEITAGDSLFRIDGIGESLELVSGATPQPVVSDERTKPPSSLPPKPIAVFQATEPTLVGQPVASPPPGSLLEKLVTAAAPFAEDAKLLAIIDGAQTGELAFLARLMGHSVYTLFSGEMAEAVAHAGPYLVALGQPLPFLEKWIETMGRNAGILLQTTAELEVLYAHLREIFVVTDEEGQEYFFRYYDPRVIRTFLPTCTAGELEEFFGVVDRWIVEDKDGKNYQIWRRGTADLLSQTV
ncbi:MAG: DUF4123 domain-containing protein [Candidatus Sumerlaeaceae bacterium]|nr:DUF4123 domain-containing protein [Candidatus Sumerlaeaceae bacterium]